MSLYTRVISAFSLSTGLTNLGVTVYDQVGEKLITRISFGIIEVTTGNYSLSIPNWDSTWSGIIKWDINGTIVYEETFTGAISLPINNSYITVEWANLYFQTRLGTDAWDNAIFSDQAKALAQATRMIDRLNFIGIKADCSQLLQWPRIIKLPCVGGSVTVGGTLPADIQMAVAELALNLLDGIDPDLEDELLGSASDAYATVRVTSDPKLARDHIKAGIISATAWRLLLPWLKDPRAITLLKG